MGTPRNPNHPPQHVFLAMPLVVSVVWLREWSWKSDKQLNYTWLRYYYWVVSYYYYCCVFPLIAEFSSLSLLVDTGSASTVIVRRMWGNSDGGSWTPGYVWTTYSQRTVTPSSAGFTIVCALTSLINGPTVLEISRYCSWLWPSHMVGRKFVV